MSVSNIVADLKRAWGTRPLSPGQNFFITDRVRSTTGRLCFDTCLSVCPHLGGGTPARSRWGGGYLSRGGYPTTGTSPSDLAGGVPFFPFFVFEKPGPLTMHPRPRLRSPESIPYWNAPFSQREKEISISEHPSMLHCCLLHPKKRAFSENWRNWPSLDIRVRAFLGPLMKVKSDSGLTQISENQFSADIEPFLIFHWHIIVFRSKIDPPQTYTLEVIGGSFESP